jgi:hypothetical protein
LVINLSDRHRRLCRDALGFSDVAVDAVGPNEAAKILSCEEFTNPAHTGQSPLWITSGEAATFIGVSDKTAFMKWARRGLAPPQHLLNKRRSFYNTVELTGWLNKQRKAGKIFRFKTDMQTLADALYDISAAPS